MAKLQSVKIDRMVIITTKPTATLRAIEKALRKCAGKDWTYDFKIDEA